MKNLMLALCAVMMVTPSAYGAECSFDNPDACGVVESIDDKKVDKPKPVKKDDDRERFDNTKPLTPPVNTNGIIGISVVMNPSNPVAPQVKMKSLGGTLLAEVCAGWDLSRDEDNSYTCERLKFLLPIKLSDNFSLLLAPKVEDSPLRGVNGNFLTFQTADGAERLYDLLSNSTRIVPQVGARFVVPNLFLLDLLIGPELEAGIDPVALAIQSEATLYVFDFELSLLYAGRYLDNVDVTELSLGGLWRIHHHFGLGVYGDYQYATTQKDGGDHIVGGHLKARSCFGEHNRFCVSGEIGGTKNGVSTVIGTSVAF